MIRERLWLGVVLSCGGVWLGCSAETSERAGEVAVVSAALSVCDETVPTHRNIDGIPAYAQCDASENSSIFSNNGIDTASTQMGPDWVQTQRSGGYQCTELAHRYLVFKWDIDWVPRGNAGSWCDTQPPDTIGIVQTMMPVHGDIMVLAPGSCGASASTGHATVVDSVDASGRLSVVEQNRANRGSYELSCARCFLHVVANDGTPGTGTAGAGAGGGGTGGAAGAPAQAGAMAPMQPAPMQPAPSTPPTTPTPAPMQPAPPATPPAVPTPVAGSNAGVVAGSTAMPPGFYAGPQSRESAASDSSCSVARAGASSNGPAYPGALVAITLALAALRLRRRPH